MGEYGCDSNGGGTHAMQALSLFDCCCCHSSKHDLIQLNCLHNYCLSCFNLAGLATQVLRVTVTVTCPVCSEVTEMTTVQTNRFLCSLRRASALRAEIVWCSVCERKAEEVTAELWCMNCAESLCAACYLWHNKFYTDHRISEHELARTLPLRHLASHVQCNLHKRPMESYCFTCCSPKCDVCLDSCVSGSHDLPQLSDTKCQEHISSTILRLKDGAMLLGSLLAGLQQKCRAAISRMRALSTSGRKLLDERRRRLGDSAAQAHDESVSELCISLPFGRYKSLNLSRSLVAECCAANTDALTVGAVRSLKILGEKNLPKTVAACCSRKVLLRCEESDSITICGSVPLTSDIVLSSCMGSTNRIRAGVRAPLLFRETFTSFETPVACWDLAVTRDGHVLLAALEHGLLMYNDLGQQLSCWRPSKWINEDDGVSSVAVLSNDQVVVSLVRARLVLLLSHINSGDTWLQDRCVAELQSPPRRLAVHGNLVAATQCKPDALRPPQMWSPDCEVTLLSLCHGKILYTQRRDYNIQNVALTALYVITNSLDTLTSSSGFSAYVVDAFSHSGSFLWRYETSAEELVWGLCVSADTWSRVYVTLWRRDRHSSVMAIGAVDDWDRREVMNSSTHGLQLPAELSLARGQQRTILAVLNWVEKDEELRTVSLYEACC